MSQQLIHTGRSLVFVSSFLLTFFLASWVNSQGIAELAEKQKIKIIEGAKKEGQLVYYTGMNLDQATVFTQEFVKKYPFIKPEIFRSSGEKVLTKYLTEARAKTYKADVFQASVIQVFQLKEQGLLQRYVSPESNAYPEGFKDPDGYWNAFYLLPYVIGYNTNLISPREAPKSYEDLLNLKWKGKIGLESEEYQWFFHLLKIMGKEKGMDFMRRLATQDLQMRHGHSLLTQLVIAGEIPICVVLYANDVEEKRTKGAPIDWVRFKGPTITAFNAISIPANPPHSNAAKLFVDFALSREGQQILQTKFYRLPARPDASPGTPSIVEGLNLYPARPEELIKNHKETVAQFKEIFRLP